MPIPRAYQTDSDRAPWNDEPRGEPEPDPDHEYESRIEAEARHVTGADE